MMIRLYQLNINEEEAKLIVTAVMLLASVVTDDLTKDRLNDITGVAKLLEGALRGLLQKVVTLAVEVPE